MKVLECKRCHSKLGNKSYKRGDIVKNPTVSQLKTAKMNHMQWRILEIEDEKPKKEVSHGKPKS